MPVIIGKHVPQDVIAPGTGPSPAETVGLNRIPFPDLGVDVWTISLPEYFSAAVPSRSVLNRDEQARAERFHRPADRKRYIAAHVGLRMTLARYVGTAPEQLHFEAGRYGKPALHRVPDRPDIRFNLSHSGDMAAIALAEGREIGIDIERIISKKANAEVAERYFSRLERVALAKLPEEDWDQGFYNCWTRKEAYIKAIGKGLSIPLGDFDVSLAPGEPAALRASRVHNLDAKRWHLREVAMNAGYAAAFAVED